jgi:hypothetical protein
LNTFYNLLWRRNNLNLRLFDDTNFFLLNLLKCWLICRWIIYLCSNLYICFFTIYWFFSVDTLNFWSPSSWISTHYNWLSLFFYNSWFYRYYFSLLFLIFFYCCTSNNLMSRSWLRYFGNIYLNWFSFQNWLNNIWALNIRTCNNFYITLSLLPAIYLFHFFFLLVHNFSLSFYYSCNFLSLFLFTRTFCLLNFFNSKVF